MDELAFLPLKTLLEPKNLFRLINKNVVEYLELRDSISDRGFINPICVRPSAIKPDFFEIIDGLNRYECAKDLDKADIPCLIKHGVSDDDVLTLQIQAQALRPEVKPAEFAKQMRKLLVRNPEMTFVDLAMLIRKSPRWVKEHLGLLNLDTKTQLSVDRGEIPLQSAYLLAKIPYALRQPYSDQARMMPAKEFKPYITPILKAHAEAVCNGRLDDFFSADYKPHPYLRNLKEVLDERESKIAGPMLIAAANAQTPLDGFYAAFDWFVHMDVESVYLQEQRLRARQQHERVITNRDVQGENLGEVISGFES